MFVVILSCCIHQDGRVHVCLTVISGPYTSEHTRVGGRTWAPSRGRFTGSTTGPLASLWLVNVLSRGRYTSTIASGVFVYSVLHHNCYCQAIQVHQTVIPKQYESIKLLFPSHTCPPNYYSQAIQVHQTIIPKQYKSTGLCKSTGLLFPRHTSPPDYYSQAMQVHRTIIPKPYKSTGLLFPSHTSPLTFYSQAIQVH